MLILSIDVGRKNLALCALEPGDQPADDRIRWWTVTACDPSPAGLKDCLDALPWLAECDEVVIERQPPKNPTMSRLQHYLEMHFCWMGKPVVVQDAKHKLAYAASTPWWPSDKVESWTYHARKKLAVATMANYLGDTPQAQEFQDLFRGSKKADDLADSALQAQAYCRHVRPLELAKRTAPSGLSKAVKPRKPTDKQLVSGKFTKPGIAYLLKRDPEAHRKNPKLERAIARQFGTLEAALEAL